MLGLSPLQATKIYLREIGRIMRGGAEGRTPNELLPLRGEEDVDTFSMTMEEIRRGEEAVRLAFTKKA